MRSSSLLALLLSTAHGWSVLSPARPRVGAPGTSTRCRPPRLELGFQVDPAASTSSVFVLGGFAVLQLKIRQAQNAREARDAAAEVLRRSEVALLAGQLTADEVQRASDAAGSAFDTYERARQVLNLPGALLRIPDPTGPQLRALLADQQKKRANARGEAPQPLSVASASADAGWSERRREDPLDGLRDRLGLLDPKTVEQRDSDEPASLLPTGSRSLTIKDVAIGIALTLQLSWFFLSLTDPMGAPNPFLGALLQSGGEMVDDREARRAAVDAEYAAMLRQAVESGEAPPPCATREIGDPLGGCRGADPEYARTRGLDADFAWNNGPPAREP